VRILFLEDDPLQLQAAARWLEASGHTVVGVNRGHDAVRFLERDSFDLAILDWMVPDLSGEAVLRSLRGRDRRMPVLFATSRDEEHEIAAILRMGADDYVVKPLRRLEFVARVEALGRRAGRSDDAEATIVVGPYVVEPRARSISLAGRAIRLTPRMMDVALMLFRRRGELVSRSYLYEQVWGHREPLESRSLDTHVSRLRVALELDGRHGVRLAPVYHHGYRLETAAPG
jgi:DNA-binding response OmpR family regulator